MDGPKGWPVLGVALEIVAADSVLEYFANNFDKFSSPAKVWLGPAILYLHVDDPKNAKAILCAEESLDKANFYRFFRLGNTIFTNLKHKWKHQRKALNTMRNKNYITAYNPIATSRAEKLVESMRRHVDGPEFNCFNYFGAYIIEAVFKATFDLDYDALDEPDENEVINKIEM
jgi:Cytochrome P450